MIFRRLAMKRRITGIAVTLCVLLAATACGNDHSFHSPGYKKTEDTQVVSTEAVTRSPGTEQIGSTEALTEANTGMPVSTEMTTEAAGGKNTEVVDGIRTELKEALDEYEEFFEGYAEFLKRYTKEYTPEMQDEYAEYMKRYEEAMAKMSSVDVTVLSNEENRYYMEVMTRVNDLISEAVGTE
jgi:hypothetical protein